MLINPDRSSIRRSAPGLALTGVVSCGLVFLAPGSLGHTQSNVSNHPIVHGNPPYDERRVVLEAREGMSQGLSREVIRATMRRYFPQLRDCFERVDKRLPSANINMSFIIDRDGKTIDGEAIDKSEPAADTEAFAQLAQCVDAVTRTMQFPAPDDGFVTVSYPITFRHEPSGED